MARLKAKALPDVEPDVEEPAADEEAATTSEPSRAVEDERESDSDQDAMSEEDEARPSSVRAVLPQYLPPRVSKLQS